MPPTTPRGRRAVNLHSTASMPERAIISRFANAPTSLRAERGLFGWCIKQTDGVVSRYFNRPISTWISRYLSHYDIQPRQLTVVTALLALATFASLLVGTLPWLVAGCVLYHVTSVVDGLDGEISPGQIHVVPQRRGAGYGRRHGEQSAVHGRDLGRQRAGLRRRIRVDGNVHRRDWLLLPLRSWSWRSALAPVAAASTSCN